MKENKQEKNSVQKTDQDSRPRKAESQLSIQRDHWLVRSVLLFDILFALSYCLRFLLFDVFLRSALFVVVFVPNKTDERATK